MQTGQYAWVYAFRSSILNTTQVFTFTNIISYAEQVTTSPEAADSSDMMDL